MTGRAREVRLQARTAHRIDGGSGLAVTKRDNKRVYRIGRKWAGLARDMDLETYGLFVVGLASSGASERKEARSTR